MALTYCTKCGHRVSTTAPRCPGCGAPRYQDPSAQTAPKASDVPTEALTRQTSESQRPDAASSSIETRACPFCGETILVVAKKCRFCGEFLDGKPAPTGDDTRQLPRTRGPYDESGMSADFHRPVGELRESGTVTALSVIGLVFGLIAMLGSFIPCIGALAFYIGIPAALVSGIGLGIAYSQNAKRTFAIVALTISLIGVVISVWQYTSIISAGEEARRQMQGMPPR